MSSDSERELLFVSYATSASLCQKTAYSSIAEKRKSIGQSGANDANGCLCPRTLAQPI